MKLTYIGRHTAVEVDLPTGGSFEVANGAQTPDLPADFAASLLEQETNWQPGDDEAHDLAIELATEADLAPVEESPDGNTGDDTPTQEDN